MNYLQKFLFDTGTDVKKNSYIWNMVAGLFTAAESVLFSMIVTRITGLSDAGIITIGFAIGNLMATIGKFGVRTFQVTDVSGKYTFSSYSGARTITVFLMIVSTAVYIAYCFLTKGYSGYKVIAVMLVCSKFVIDSYEDVVAGECQKSGRLDASSKMYVLRSFCFITVFMLLLLMSKNLLIALTSAVVAAACLEGMLLLTVKSHMNLSFRQGNIRQIRDIIRKCTPLFLSAFFFFYITNAPKYAIDTVMNDEVQACYSFIAFPVFAIELLNNFIYQPVLVELAVEWTQKEYAKVRRRIYRQLIIVAALTVLALFGAYLIGIPVLSLVFSTDLSGYKSEMLVLLFGGGLLAVIGYLSTILITMRRSMLMIYGYSVDFIASLFLYKRVIGQYGVMGGVVLYCILCFAFALFEYISIEIIMKKSEMSAKK